MEDVGAHRLTPAQETRVAVAFVAQPFVVALVTLIIFPLIASTGPRLVGFNSVRGALALAVYLGLICVPVIPLAAVPAFAWLVSRGALTRARVLVGGAMIGNVPLPALLLAVVVRTGSGTGVARGMDEPFQMIRSVGIGSVVGFLSASVFWVMVRRSIPAYTPATPSAL